MTTKSKEDAVTFNCKVSPADHRWNHGLGFWFSTADGVVVIAPEEPSIGRPLAAYLRELCAQSPIELSLEHGLGDGEEGGTDDAR